MKVGCIVQGDIRRGTELVVNSMKNKFDVVILSTWKDDLDNLPKISDCEVVVSDKPLVAGLSHRNYQRFSTAAGLRRAKELKCDYVLKWRTDMLATNLKVNELINWSKYDIPDGVSSRIVTCAYRNHTVNRDWFSSIPDLFAFGDVDTMELLWGDKGFDYTKTRNVPEKMIEQEGNDWIEKDQKGATWCAESELYAIFKDRLQKKLKKELSHEEIAKKYFRLIDYNKLHIIWFNKTSGFRPIFQGWEHNWWNENDWKSNKSVKKGNFAYTVKGLLPKIKLRLSFLLSKYEVLKQMIYFDQLKL